MKKLLALSLAICVSCSWVPAEMKPEPAGKARNVTFISTSDSHFKAFESKGWNAYNRETIEEINRIAKVSWPEKLGGARIDSPRGVGVLGDCIDDGDKVRDGKNYDPAVIRDAMIFGTPDQVIEKCELYEDVGVDILMLGVNFGLDPADERKSLELFIKEVAPHFAKREAEKSKAAQ